MLQKELKEVVNYNPETGEMVWIKPSARRNKIGDKVGSITGNGYTETHILGERSYLHRIAFLYMTGKFPKNAVDHINHDRNDNRWVNLREVTKGENHKNRAMSKFNKSGFNGVRWCDIKKRWKAYISVDGKVAALGSFLNKKDAVESRKQANIKYGYHTNHGN